MHDSFSSGSTLRVWEITICPLDFPHFGQFASSLRTKCGGVCLVDPRWGLQQHYNNLSVFYTRLTCVHVQPAPPTPSTAPPLSCETRPAQKPSIIEYQIYTLLCRYVRMCMYMAITYSRLWINRVRLPLLS